MFSQEKYEKRIIPFYLVIGSLLLNLVYLGLARLMEYIPWLGFVSRMDWNAAANSMETLSSASTAIIFVGVIILEVFTNRYFPVIKYFFYNIQCLFIFTYTVSVSIFAYFSTFAYPLLPYAPLLAFVLLSIQMIMLGLYFIFYIVSWTSPAYTITIIEKDIRCLIAKAIRISRNSFTSQEHKANYYLQIKKKIFQLLSYLMTAADDIDKIVATKAIFSISNILIYYQHHKAQIPEPFFILSPREKDDRDIVHLNKHISIQDHKLILEAKCLSLLNDIFALLLFSNRQGPDDICSVLDEYSSILIETDELNIPLMHIINVTYFRFMNTCLETDEEFAALRILDRIYHMLQSYLHQIESHGRGQPDPPQSYPILEHVIEQMKDYSVAFYRKNMTDVLEKTAQILFLFIRDIVRLDRPEFRQMEQNLLNTFLQIDMPPDPSQVKDISLINVRVAQALLASLYEGKPGRNGINSIELIVNDMKDEEPNRLRAIERLTLQNALQYNDIPAELVNRFFQRFKTKVLILSDDTRFDRINPPAYQIIRTDSIRDFIIKLNLTSFHLFILDDIPAFLGFREMIDLVLNFLPDTSRVVLYVEFGHPVMQTNLYKLAALRLPFRIKYFKEDGELDEDEFQQLVSQMVYGPAPGLGDMKPNLERLRGLFE
ncbi:MAG: hypothetical protein KBA26_13500 [Candidatus Delongbacteria bacterium]|nr:hypothetical protein [Candidatus Delongbacteria bacterium]